MAEALDRSARTYVAGHRGLVGSAVWRHLLSAGFTDLVGQTSTELDLRDRDAARRFFTEQRPRYVVLAAAKVGGILANDTYPADFLSENLRIQVNVLDAALEAGVERLLFLGSSCIYPRLAEQPIREDSLLTGPLEPTNDAYAIAKIAGVLHVQAMRRQHGVRWVSAMPTNLYGPGDNFSALGSHMLPGLVRRYVDAVLAGDDVVTNWRPEPRRELLHVDDLGSACLHLLEHYDDPAPINIGTGKDATIAEIAALVAEAAGFTGRTQWDATKPAGTPQKLLDVTRINDLGWRARIDLREGIASTVSWYREHRGAVRG